VDIKIGELRHRIKFQRLSRTSDGQGGALITWNDLQTCWAKIESSLGDESQFAEKLRDTKHFKITIRNTLDFEIQKAMDRIEYEGRYFQIKSIENVDERKFWIMLKVEEGVAS
jgi:SPP1 family predicted phage head-tail adaptor